MIRIELDTRPLAQAVKELGERASVAMVRAVNKSAASGRTQLARDVAEDMGINVGDVRKRITVQKATTRDLTATIRATAERLPVMAFRARELKRGGIAAKLPGSPYRHAFIATVRTKGAVENRQFHAGHKGVFARKGKARLPIEELFGPSIAHVAKKHEPAATERAVEQLAKNVKHEIDFELQRMRKG